MYRARASGANSAPRRIAVSLSSTTRCSSERWTHDSSRSPRRPAPCSGRWPSLRTRRDAISAAPLAYRDLVVTGVATPDMIRGGQGFIAAYDANSGTERWRFMTITKPGGPGSETWAGNSGREGGAPTWLTGSYDPELDLLIWGVGNPKPVFDAAARRGDNLYTNSAVALRGSTGALVWYFQFTPADDHDWDANQIPVLADQTTPRGTEKRILWANRNGFYYVLDRASGKYLTATPFA